MSWQCVVTGGCGFIGSNIVRALLSDGATVRVIDDLSSGYAENLEGVKAELHVGDICDEAVVDRVVARADAIFHLAASVGNKRSLAHPLRDSEVNVMGTLRLLEAARRHKVKRFVFSSSAGTFGELRTNPIDEQHPQEPITPYGTSKLAAEKHTLVYGFQYDMVAVALRYFNVYGPRQRFDEYGNVIPIFAHRIVNGEPVTVFGDGEQTRDFVHVDDVVQANLRGARDAKRSAVYNVGSGTSISINELVAMLQRTTPARFTVTHGPERPGDVRHCRADISAIGADLGFRPTRPLEAGVADYLRWFEQDPLARRTARVA